MWQGQTERDTAYLPILDALERRYTGLGAEQRCVAALTRKGAARRTTDDAACRNLRAGLKVLVPGAGLGRLAWEVVRAGMWG